jgi:hypothetical protein
MNNRLIQTKGYTMSSNIFRNFYYIDSETLDNYLSSMHGSIYDSEDVSEKHVNNKGAEAGITLPPAKFNAGIKTHIETETRKKVIQTYAGKFQEIYAYLEKNGGIPFYEQLDDDSWNEISRNQFIELDVSLRFSKIDTLISSISNFIPMFGEMDINIEDDNSKKTIQLMQLFNEITKQSGLPAELQLINGGKYKFVAYFNHDCFVKNLELIPNEVTILAKIQRKLKDSEKINLINVVPLLEKMAINREMRKSMKHNKNNMPEELYDNVKGPGALLIPIALYN